MNSKKVNKIFEKFSKDTELDLEIENKKDDDGNDIVTCHCIFTDDDYKINSCFFHSFVNCDDGYASVSLTFDGALNMNLDSYSILNDLNNNSPFKFYIDNEDEDKVLLMEYDMFSSTEEQLDELIRTFLDAILDDENINDINELLSYAK